MKLQMFLTEEISSNCLFISFNNGDNKSTLTKLFKHSKFVKWADLSIEDGNIFADGKPLSTFKAILLGTVGDNDAIYSCVKAYVEKHKIPFISYGMPRMLCNKLLQTVQMEMHQVSQIKTIIGNSSKLTASSLIKALKLPIVSKIVDGSQGKGVKKHDTKESLMDFLVKSPEKNYIFQEFIPNDGDYRAFFLKNKLVYSIKRTSKKASEFRNNISLGGIQESTELPAEAKKLALAACKSMDFDIAGIDLVQHKETKKWYVIEINAAPQFDGPEFDLVIDAITTYIKEIK